MCSIISRIRQFAELAWKSRAIGTFLWAALVGAILWFLWYPPPPGMAAIVLGALAAAMTLREMGPTQKLFVVLAIFGLAALEIRGINRERIEQDVERNESEKTLQGEFSKVSDQNQRAFEKTEAHMETSIAQAQMILTNITGGDNYLIVKAIRLDRPINGRDLVLYAFNDNDVPLPNPGMCVMTPNGDSYEENRCPVWPVLPAHDRRGSGFLVVRDKYTIELTAANGPHEETLQINRAKNTQHITITGHGTIVYDHEISIP